MTMNDKSGVSFDDEAISDISKALVNARKTRTVLNAFPGELPGNSETAYAVQLHSIANWPRSVVGWKVGGINPPFDVPFKAKKLAGPVFDDQVYSVKDGGTVKMPVFKGGFAAYEPEFIVKMGDTSGLNGPVTGFDDFKDMIDSVYIGAEIASSPMPKINAWGPGSIISDFGNNCGIVLGPEVKDFAPASLQSSEVTTDIKGKGTFKANLKGEAPYDSCVFLFNHLRKIGMDIPAGTYVSTGAITGVHDAVVGDSALISFAGLGAFRIDLTA